MSADFNAGSIEGTLDLDTAPFLAGLKLARNEARRFEGTTIKAKLDVDTKEATAKEDAAKLKLDEFGAKKATAKADVDVAPAMAKMALLSRVLDAGGLGNASLGPGLLLGRLAAIVGGLMAVTAAAGPVATALAGVGTAGIAAFAGLGISIGLFAKVATSDMAKVQDAIKKGINLNGPAGVAERALKGLTGAWHSLQKATAPATFSALGSIFGMLQGILPKLAPLINTVAHGVTVLVESITRDLHSSTFGQFLKDLQRFMAGFLKGAGPVIVDLLDAFMNGFHQLLPLIRQLGKWITNAAEGLSGFVFSGGFKQFLATAKKDLPLVEHLLGSAFKLIGSLMHALGPLSGPALHFITTLVGSLSHLDLTPFTKGFGMVLNVLKPLLPIGVQLVNVVLKPLGALVGALAKGPLKDLVDSIGTRLAPVFGDFGKLLQALVKPLTAFIGSIANLANPTGIKLIASLMHVLMQVVSSLAGPLSSVAVLLESVIDTALEALVPILVKVSPMFAMLARIIGHTLTEAVKILAPVFAQVVKELFPVLEQVIVALMPVVEELAKAIFPALIQVIKALVPVIGPLLHIIVELATKVLIPILIPAIKLAAKQFEFAIKVIADVITWVAKGLAWFLKFAEGPQQAQKAIKIAFDAIKRWTSDLWGWIHDRLNDIKNLAKSIGNWFTDTFVGFFRDAYRAISDKLAQWGRDIKAGFDKVTGWAQDIGSWFKRTFTGFFSDAWSDIKKTWSALGSGLKDEYTQHIKPIWGWIQDGLTAVKKAFGTAETTISKVWGKIQDAAEAPVRFVINTVLDKGIIPAVNKVGGIFPGYKALPTVTAGFARGGKVPGNSPTDTADDQLARVTSGEFYLRRWAARKLERVFPGLLEYMNDKGTLPGFAGGGWVGKLISSATPVGLFTSSIKSLISKIPGASTREGEIAVDASDSLMDKGEDWIKSKLGMMSPIGSVIGGIKNLIGGTGVSRWAPQILKALSMLGQPSSLLGAVEYRMNRESGGNPNAINNWDSNAAAGDPSRGLMQTIGSTFAAYAGPFRGLSIYNPMANIYAALNYALHAYGSIARAMYQPGGYLLGGRVPADGLAALSEDGRAELVAGPQMRRLKAGSRVYNADETAALLGGGGRADTDRLIEELRRLVAMIMAANRPLIGEYHQDGGASAQTVADALYRQLQTGAA